MKGLSAIAATFVLCLVLAAHPALAAASNPGDACSPDGIAGVNGVMRMTCTSGVWVLDALKLGNSSVTCNSSNAGYLKFDGTGFSGCDGSNWGLYITGNVGIGTMPSTDLLDIAGYFGHVTVPPSGAVLTFSRSGANYIQASSTGGWFDFIVNGNANSDSSAAMKIDLNGNVGIGTTAPTTKLEVNGTITTSLLTAGGFVILYPKAGAPQTCTAGIKGAVSMTTNNGLCFCNGSAWNKVEAPATACAW